MPKMSFSYMTVVDKNSVEHQVAVPVDGGSMTQYLETLMSEAAEDQYNRRDYIVNIMAARKAKKVAPNKRSALDAMTVTSGADVIGPIVKEQKKLLDSAAMQEYLKARSDEQLVALVSSGGHGGKLERDFAKHVCTHKGPMLADTPKRYMPFALTRIEALQKQLKALKRDAPDYKQRAASICKEIVATRAAVDCTPGDKSTLKHKYDPAKMNSYYNGLMRTAGKDLSDENLNRLMRGALKTPGHGGTMEKVVEDLVREDMQRSRRLPEADVPARYQVTCGERIKMLRGEISRAMKDGSPEAKQKLKSALAEMSTLSGHGMDEKLRPDEKVQKIAASKSFDRFVDELMQDEGKRSVLGDALSRDENYGQEVARFVAPAYEEATKEMALTSEKLTPEEREKRISERTEELKKNFAQEDRQVEGKKGTELRGEMAKELDIEATNLAMYRDADDKLISPAESLRRMRELFDKQMAMTHAYNKSIDKNTGRVNEQEYARQLNGSRFQLNLEEVRQDPTYQKMMENMIKDRPVEQLLLPMSMMVKDPEKLQSRYQAELQKQDAVEKENELGLNKEQVKEEELNLI